MLSPANGCVYEGDFHKGERHGQGICTFPGGERYNGGWGNGKMHGEGTLEIRERTLTGSYTHHIAIGALPIMLFGYTTPPGTVNPGVLMRPRCVVEGALALARAHMSPPPAPVALLAFPGAPTY